MIDYLVQNMNGVVTGASIILAELARRRDRGEIERLSR
jgi:hypothetical protein